MSGIRTPTGFEGIGAIRYRNGASALVGVGTVRLRTDSGLEVVFSGFSASVSPTFSSGEAYSAAAPQISTSIVYTSVSGGTPPYTYAWTLSAGWSALNPTSGNTGFRSPHCFAGTTESGTASVEVTDANGNTATSNTISLDATNTYAGP